MIFAMFQYSHTCLIGCWKTRNVRGCFGGYFKDRFLEHFFKITLNCLLFFWNKILFDNLNMKNSFFKLIFRKGTVNIISNNKVLKTNLKIK